MLALMIALFLLCIVADSELWGKSPLCGEMFVLFSFY